MRRAVEKLLTGDVHAALEAVGESGMQAHYRIWNVPGGDLEIENLEDSFRRLSGNPSILSDLIEILE